MQRFKMQKNGIALLITVMFIMLITVSIGTGLKSINEGKKIVSGEQFSMQSTILLHDLLEIFKKTPELEKIATAVDLTVFLSSTSFIPLEYNGIGVKIEISSARSKLNPNTFKDPARLEHFKEYLNTKMVNIEYANMLLDAMSGIKADMSYYTDIFNEKPYLFRDYIASHEHLDEIADSYMKNYHEANVLNLNTRELFYISSENNTSVDLNQATADTWQLLLNCDEARALTLYENSGAYATKEDLLLSSEEQLLLDRFQTSFFEPYLDVNIELTRKEQVANIRFEYDIKLKKGSNFVYEL